MKRRCLSLCPVVGGDCWGKAGVHAVCRRRARKFRHRRHPSGWGRIIVGARRNERRAPRASRSPEIRTRTCFPPDKVCWKSLPRSYATGVGPASPDDPGSPPGLSRGRTPSPEMQTCGTCCVQGEMAPLWIPGACEWDAMHIDASTTPQKA